MTVLNRYLLRRNLFLLFALLLVGAGIYVLSDLFQRIDVFLDADQGLGIIALYYLIKLPLIISQILPAVFLLAMVVQLLLMTKNRESIALQSGGVSPAAMLRFIIIYGLIWSCLQFAFAQVLGVQGERISDEMWQADVRGRDTKNIVIDNLVFTQGNYVVQMQKSWPLLERAENVHIYKLTPNGDGMEASYSAKSAESGKKSWVLHDVEIIEPATYSYSRQESLELEIRQNLKPFENYDEDASVSDISLPQLYETIERLEKAGTNTEALKTHLQGRFSYSGSILVMGLLALAISMYTENLYLGIVLSLVCTFFFYISGAFFSAMGEAGTLPPYLAAWLSNIIFTLTVALYLASQYLRTIRRKA